MSYDASNNVNPYAPYSFQKAKINPSLADVISLACKRTALNLRVCVPCKIVNIMGAQFVDVLPLIQQRVFEDAVDYPVITGVMVCMPISAGYSLQLPLQVGDTGVLLCSDRSLDAYMAGDGKTPADPASERNHELTDGIFLPGLVPAQSQTTRTTDMVMTNGKASLHLQKDGKVTFSNGQEELMQLLVKTTNQLATLAQVLTTAQVLTALGPAPFLASTVTLLNNVATTMQDVNARLTTLKGT